MRTIPVDAFDGPAPAVNAYLSEMKALQHSNYCPPCRGAFAVATAVTNDEIAFTNSKWRFLRSDLRRELELDALLVLNDFEALALSLPLLGPAQVQSQHPLIAAHGTLAVIGPGTGLGVAGVVQTNSGWVALPGEGGHSTLAAGDDFESELLRHLRKSFHHVSAERVLSGIGLPLLHGAVVEVLGYPVSTLDAVAIVQRSLDGTDIGCVRTLEVFCSFLGSFAGNVALTLGARGGVFIGGGIVPRLGTRFFHTSFRDRFEAKGRFQEYLRAIPTAVITDTLAALCGVALALEQSCGGPGIE